jgi:hypothetical protein
LDSKIQSEIFWVEDIEYRFNNETDGWRQKIEVAPSKNLKSRFAATRNFQPSDGDDESVEF